MVEDIKIEIFVGIDSSKYVDYVSKLRIDTFKEYPYLYKGELDYERKYMIGYTLDNKAMVAIAKLNGVIAGISTGIPLISDSKIVTDAKKIFEQKNIDPETYYYYGEVIVLPQFRRKGVTKKLYEAQDVFVREWGYQHVCILTVVREEDHPLKPIGYESPNRVWESMGFHRINLRTIYHWPTIQPDGSIKDLNNELEFWSKKL